MNEETNLHDLRECIKGYSLIDITSTGIIAPYNSNTVPFTDDSGQVIDTKNSWNKSRNQQRNWETLIQLISMITQPIILQKPILLKDENLSNHKFKNKEKHNMWHFIIGAEQEGIFDSSVSIGKLTSICHKIPININLNETIASENYFDTFNDINLYFEKIQF